MTRQNAVPVLIAGAGPVGMTLAYDLARRGIRSVIVERNATTTRHPKMDITNIRSMELFTRLGLSSAMRAAAVPESHCFDVSWVTSMVGHELHRFRYPSVTSAREQILACNDGSQPAEPAMRVSQIEIEPVLKRAIDEAALIDVRFGTTFESLQQDCDGVTAVIYATDGGPTEALRCRYLVGCDGGGSAVRECLGIGMSGDRRIMQRFTTYFQSDARDVLQRWGTAWHYQSPLGTLIAQNDRDLWTLHSRLPDDWDFANVDPSALLTRFLGTEIEHRVLVANRWSPHLLVADRYSSGRVLLAGDAAHQYIPSGGYGMNTGIGDAADLGWKLAAVLHGFAGPRLLESYDAERRPVGLRNREGSRAHTELRRRIFRLYQEAGVYEAAELTEPARRELGERIAEAGNAENESTGIEMGYSYAGSPVICTDETAKAPDDPGRYQPSTVPGVRLPSLVLDDGSFLHDRLGPWFTLVAVGTPPDPDLVSAARRQGVPLQVVTLTGDWLIPILGRQQLLIRPDQHIGWRGQAAGGGASEVFRTLLCREAAEVHA